MTEGFESDEGNENEDFPDYKLNGYHPVHLGGKLKYI